jgi:hypothetical protein
MPKQLLNEAEGFLIERWDDACRLKKSMKSVRNKYEKLLGRVKNVIEKKYPKLNSNGAWLDRGGDDGSIGFGRKSWPHDEDNEPSGLWIINLGLTQLADESSNAPNAIIWIELPKEKVDKVRAAVIKEAIEKKWYKTEELAPKELEGFEGWSEFYVELPAPSKKELLTALSSGHDDEFVEALVKQFNQLARFIPILDNVFNKYYGEEFRRLAAVWQKETDHLSSMEQAEKHPAYQEIIKLGRGVIPFLLRDLAENHTHWFAALEAITGEQPLSEEIAGYVPKMTEAWLSWAQKNGYEW